MKQSVKQAVADRSAMQLQAQLQPMNAQVSKEKLVRATTINFGNSDQASVPSVLLSHVSKKLHDTGNLRDLFRRTEKYLLRDLDLAFGNRAECVRVQGNDVKSAHVFLRMIAGFYKPDQGNIAVCGRILYLHPLICKPKNNVTLRNTVHLATHVLGLPFAECKNIELYLNESYREEFDKKATDIKPEILIRFSVELRQKIIESFDPDILIVDDAVQCFPAKYAAVVQRTLAAVPLTMYSGALCAAFPKPTRDITLSSGRALERQRSRS